MDAQTHDAKEKSKFIFMSGIQRIGKSQKKHINVIIFKSVSFKLIWKITTSAQESDMCTSHHVEAPDP